MTTEELVKKVTDLGYFHEFTDKNSSDENLLIYRHTESMFLVAKVSTTYKFQMNTMFNSAGLNGKELFRLLYEYSINK